MFQERSKISFGIGEFETLSVFENGSKNFGPHVLRDVLDFYLCIESNTSEKLILILIHD